LVNAGNGRDRDLPPSPGSGEEVILLTAHGSKENMIEGLRAGADDYLVKPFHAEELQARILVGLRVMTSQETLADRVQALETSLPATGSLKLRIPL
jgi:DNA-binding response OmpR family regulator